MLENVTRVVCDRCGARSGLGDNAQGARDEASRQGWGQLTRHAWEQRRRRLTAATEDLCPACLGVLTEPQVIRAAEEVLR